MIYRRAMCILIVCAGLLPTWVFAAQVCQNKTCVDAQLVSTPQDMARGLSGHAPLADRQGMLFVFDDASTHGFWMKEMLFDLDIVWIDEQSNIVHIEHDLKPCTAAGCPVYSPNLPSHYVLEVPAGFCAKHRWAIGTHLTLAL